MKYILGILCLLIAQTPPNTNIYCGKTLEDFHGVITCPSDGIYEVNTECADACLLQYQECMLYIYNDACSRSNDANANFDTNVNIALESYANCIASAHTPEEIQECRRQTVQNLHSARDTLLATLTVIDSDLISGTIDCEAELTDCSANCCVKVGDFPPKPGDH